MAARRWSPCAGTARPGTCAVVTSDPAEMRRALDQSRPAARWTVRPAPVDGHPDQVLRLEQFRAEHPERVIEPGAFWRARRADNDAQTVVHAHLRGLLDKLDAITGGQQDESPGERPAAYPAPGRRDAEPAAGPDVRPRAGAPRRAGCPVRGPAGPVRSPVPVDHHVGSEAGCPECGRLDEARQRRPCRTPGHRAVARGQVGEKAQTTRQHLP
jgi:hypothetical protein